MDVPEVALPETHLDIFDDRPTGYMASLRPDGQISVNPVALLRDGNLIKISTVKTRKKYRNIGLDPRIAVCVVQRNNPNRYIEVRGTAELVDDPDRVFCDAVAKEYMDADRYPFDRPGDERAVIVVHPEQVSAPRMPLVNHSPLAPDAAS